MPSSVPHYLIPPPSLFLRCLEPSFYSQTISRLSMRSCRHASTTDSSTGRPPPAKHTSLDKPDKFRPPSHPARLNRKPPRHYGGPLSEAEKAKQATKKYPNMMPPKGSFMYWFIHNPSIHLYIVFVSPPSTHLPLPISPLSPLPHSIVRLKSSPPLFPSPKLPSNQANTNRIENLKRAHSAPWLSTHSPAAPANPHSPISCPPLLRSHHNPSAS